MPGRADPGWLSPVQPAWQAGLYSRSCIRMPPVLSMSTGPGRCDLGVEEWSSVAKQRQARVSSEAGASVSLRRVSGREGVSQVFRYELTLLSPSHDLDLDALLGTGMTVEA